MGGPLIEAVSPQGESRWRAKMAEVKDLGAAAFGPISDEGFIHVLTRPFGEAQALVAWFALDTQQ